MRISARCCYAILAAVELARAGDGRSVVPVRDLAARTGVPRGFLVQILQSLRRAGVVESIRGAGGGYRLAAPPAEISAGRVLRAAGERGGFVESSGFAGKALEGGGSPEAARALGFVLAEAERSLARALEGVTLAALLARGRGRGAGAAPDYVI